MDSNVLLEQLHDARYVYCAHDTHLMYIWYGGSMVHIMSNSFQELDVFTDYDLNADNIRSKIVDHIKLVKSEGLPY